MTTTTSQSSHDRFSRIGFKFGQKPQQEFRGRAAAATKGPNDDEWYIPYTGPIEAPPKPRSAKNNRDSWGDPILDLNSPHSFGVTSPQVHYDSSSSDPQDYRSSEESRGRTRGRSQSVTSAFTASTGIDHGRTSYSAQRQSNVSSSHRSAIPSYVHLDAGGVGESPVPIPRHVKPLSHRASLGSLFSTFGIKSPSGPGFTNRRMRSPSRKLSLKSSVNSGVGASGNRVMSVNYHRHTASGDSHNHLINTKRDTRDPPQSVDSHATTAEDYYNSYYSTLLQTPVKPLFSTPTQRRPSIPASELPPSRRDPSTSQHPYALVFPETEDLTKETPNSAPPSAGIHHHPIIIPKLVFSESNTPLPRPNFPTPNPSNPDADGAARRDLKGSVSTPNLMSAKNNSGASRALPKGIDKWLSAETWCDALLFPRPRLKVKNEGKDTVGRIVSPPGSPVVQSGLASKEQTDSVPSRVLAHSRSLASLREEKEEAIRQEKLQAKTPLHQPASSQTQLRADGDNTPRTTPSGHLRPPRPKSWAQDDLDLPSPVPSLAK